MINIKNTDILNVKVNFGLSFDDVFEGVTQKIKSNSKGIICTTNPEFILNAQTDSELLHIINDSYLSLPDGSGLVFAEKYLSCAKQIPYTKFRILSLISCGLKLGFDSFIHPENYKTMPGIDLMDYLCAKAEENNLNVFLLGGWPKSYLGKAKKGNYDIAYSCAQILSKKYPKLSIIGATSKFSYKEKDDVETTSYINKCLAEKGTSVVNILFVAFGNPEQEKWLSRNLSSLNIHIGMGVGGSFDVLSGVYPRAPYIIRKYHLEWLFRLIIQPYRFRRIAHAFITFPFNVLEYTL